MLFYIFRVILGILTVRKINKKVHEENEVPMSENQAVAALLIILIPIVNLLMLCLIWCIIIIENVKRDPDSIKISWINKLLGIRN
jgi:archaellum biogenesis protein FlaJ (TadC family)